MLQYYDFSAQTTGAAFPVASPGRFIYYLGGSAGGADPTIAVRAGNTGQSVLLKPGQAVRLGDSDKSVDTWYIANYAKAAQIIGTVLVGDGEFEDNRITGSVEVIDGGKSRTLAGGAYMAGAPCGSVAGQNPYVQLWNPAGSGKNVIVEAVTYSSSQTGGVGFRMSTVGLTTFSSNGVSKLSSGAVSAASVRTQNSAAALGGVNMLLTGISAGAFSSYVFKEPVVLAPGAGLIVTQGIVASDVTATFEWYEESV